MAIKTTKPASIQVARNTPKTEPAPSARGLLWFDEQGHLNQSGAVTLDGYVGELLAQLRRFLSRLDALERTAGGDYRLRDSRLGNMSGTRVLWDNVALLARAALFKTLPAMTAAQHSEMKSTGVCVTTTGPMRNDRPLTDALRQLLFAPLYNDDGTWVSEIPAATVAKIRTIVDELTPAVAVPPAGDGEPAVKKSKDTRQQRGYKWLAEAMLTVSNHPEWSDATIATKVGIDKSTLSRSPQYRRAASMARTPRVPRGSVTMTDGGRKVDAEDNSFNPNRPASRQSQYEEDTDERIEREEKEEKRNAKRNGR